MKNFRTNCVAAVSNMSLAEAIEAAAEREGMAIGTVRYHYGVVGRRPARKRQATSGKGPQARRDRSKMVAVPQ